MFFAGPCAFLPTNWGRRTLAMKSQESVPFQLIHGVVPVGGGVLMSPTSPSLRRFDSVHFGAAKTLNGFGTFPWHWPVRRLLLWPSC